MLYTSGKQKRYGENNSWEPLIITGVCKHLGEPRGIHKMHTNNTAGQKLLAMSIKYAIPFFA